MAFLGVCMTIFFWYNGNKTDIAGNSETYVLVYDSTATPKWAKQTKTSYETSELDKYKAAATAALSNYADATAQSAYTVDGLKAKVTKAVSDIGDVTYSGTLTTDKADVDTAVNGILKTGWDGLDSSSLKSDETYLTDAQTAISALGSGLKKSTDAASKTAVETAIGDLSLNSAVEASVVVNGESAAVTISIATANESSAQPETLTLNLGD